MKRLRAITFILALALPFCLGAGGFGCGDDNPDDAGVEGKDGASNTDGAAGNDASGGGPDGGDFCGPMDIGPCTDGALSCLCCPGGGPTENCLCTTPCMSSNQCTDPARPMCNQQDAMTMGICTSTTYVCAWGSVCAAPDTPIATPEGEMSIASLSAGDLVYSMDGGRIRAVPILKASRTRVRNHSVVRVLLTSGRMLEISPGHPTADGRLFGELQAGDDIGGARAVTVGMIAYEHAYTYDILPASDSGTYLAAGAWIGSTLARETAQSSRK